MKCDFCNREVDKTYTSKRVEHVVKTEPLTTVFDPDDPRYISKDYEICFSCKKTERVKNLNDCRMD